MREVDSRRIPIFRSQYADEKHQEQQLISLYRHTLQLVKQDSSRRNFRHGGSPPRRPATSYQQFQADAGRDGNKSVKFRVWQPSNVEEKTFYPKTKMAAKEDRNSEAVSVDQNYFRASRPSHYIRYTYPTKFHPHPPTAKVIESVPDCFRRSTAFSRMPFRQSTRQPGEDEERSGKATKSTAEKRKSNKSPRQENKFENQADHTPEVENDKERELNGVFHMVHSDDSRAQESSTRVLEIDVNDFESASEHGEIKTVSDDEKSETDDLKSVSSEKDNAKSSKSQTSDEEHDDSDGGDEYEEDFET